jgi:hypothetical protein
MSLTTVNRSMIEVPASGVLGGSGTINHSNSFVLGSGLVTNMPDTTFVNNLSANGKIYGDGSPLISKALTETPAVFQGGYKNRIQNGAFLIDQRNNFSSVTISGTNTVTYPADRWYVKRTGSGIPVGSNLTGQVLSEGPSGTPFTKSLKVTSGSLLVLASDGMEIEMGQLIEGHNLYDLQFGSTAAKNITISFWVKAGAPDPNTSATGNYLLAIKNSSGSRAYYTTFTVNTEDAWEYKTVTIPGDVAGSWSLTNDKALKVSVILWAFRGSDNTLTLNQWGASVTSPNYSNIYFPCEWINSYVQITGFQLETGSSATPFEWRNFGTELADCQRYYEKIWVILRNQINTVQVFPKVEKRTIPTLNVGYISGSGAVFKTANDNTSYPYNASLPNGAVGYYQSAAHNTDAVTAFLEVFSEMAP